MRKSSPTLQPLMITEAFTLNFPPFFTFSKSSIPVRVILCHDGLGLFYSPAFSFLCTLGKVERIKIPE